MTSDTPSTSESMKRTRVPLRLLVGRWILLMWYRPVRFVVGYILVGGCIAACWSLLFEPMNLEKTLWTWLWLVVYGWGFCKLFSTGYVGFPREPVINLAAKNLELPYGRVIPIAAISKVEAKPMKLVVHYHRFGVRKHHEVEITGVCDRMTRLVARKDMQAHIEQLRDAIMAARAAIPAAECALHIQRPKERDLAAYPQEAQQILNEASVRMALADARTARLRV